MAKMKLTRILRISLFDANENSGFLMKNWRNLDILQIFLRLS